MIQRLNTHVQAAHQSWHARFWEIDALRGLAVVLMIFFHLMWDLAYFGLAEINIYAWPWQAFARSIGGTFILLLGLSLALQLTRSNARALWMPTLRRGCMLFGLGMIITIVTRLLLGEGFIVFGILHMLGISLIMAYPLTRWPLPILLLLSVLVIALGIALDQVVVSYPWLIWLGARQEGRVMADYYPLFPWFGVVLLGIGIGRTLYPQGERRRNLPELRHIAPIRALCFLGRHALLIYLIHQPILLGLLFGFGARPPA